MYTIRMPAPINWGSLKYSLPPRVSLHRQVAGRLGLLIAEGQLIPGSVLPNESQLGANLGVSRTALREAIKVLAAKGLVDVRRKTGTRVRPNSQWNMLDPEVLFWLFSGPDVPAGLTDLLEVRKIVEPAGARMAAERATLEDLAEMQRAFEAMEAAANDLDSRVETDLLFHLSILEGAHNAFMRPFGALIQAALRTSFRLTSSNTVAYRRTLTLHREVLAAIKSRNRKKAEAAMLLVLAQTSKDVAAELQKAKKGIPLILKRRQSRQ
ncbi:MAG: FadR/GntR family transcriptional regulator [Terriglobales bacterium]